MAAAAFTWIVLGLLVAGIAKFVAWDNTPLAWTPVLVAGAVGGALGGYLRSFFPAGEVPVGFDPAALLLAIGGAALVVWAWYVTIGRAKLAKSSDMAQRRAA